MMIENFPLSIECLFIFCVVYTIGFFHLSNNKPSGYTGVIILWAIIQSILAYSGFYHDSKAFPPRFIFVLIVPIFMFIYIFRKNNLDHIIENRNTKLSTFLHAVRIPVEITLYYLFIHSMVPELMTFEGRNFDILAGITACIVGVTNWYDHASRKIMILWNCIGLALVLFILVNGLLSAKLPFQQFGFEQPNVALNYFPFVLLPAVIVPLVVFTHITDIIKFLRS